MPSLAQILGEAKSHDFRKRVLKMNEDHTKVATLAKWSERWIKAAATNERPTRWMALVGSPGTGKSHAMRAAYEFLRTHNVDLWKLGHYSTPPSARFAVWSKVVALGPGMWADFEEDVHRSKFVFLDDVGSETDRFKSGESTERLRLILDLCRTKWLMVSSNLTRETFGRAFDARISSRFQQAAVLDMTGAPDYRARRDA